MKTHCSDRLYVGMFAPCRKHLARCTAVCVVRTVAYIQTHSLGLWWYWALPVKSSWCINGFPGEDASSFGGFVPRWHFTLFFVQYRVRLHVYIHSCFVHNILTVQSRKSLAKRTDVCHWKRARRHLLVGLWNSFALCLLHGFDFSFVWWVAPLTPNYISDILERHIEH